MKRVTEILFGTVFACSEIADYIPKFEMLDSLYTTSGETPNELFKKLLRAQDERFRLFEINGGCGGDAVFVGITIDKAKPEEPIGVFKKAVSDAFQKICNKEIASAFFSINNDEDWEF